MVGNISNTLNQAEGVSGTEDKDENIWNSCVSTEKKLRRHEETKERNQLTGAVLKPETRICSVKLEQVTFQARQQVDAQIEAFRTQISPESSSMTHQSPDARVQSSYTTRSCRGKHQLPL